MRKKYRDNRFDTATPDTIPVVRDALSRTKDMSGDYYEFGLFKGYSFAKAHDFARELGVQDIRFFGFDSFEGLPDVAGIDAGSKFSAGNYACSLEKVTKNLKDRMRGSTYFIKGFYDKTLNDSELLKKYDFRPARVVLVDCDLYSSTKDVLRFVRSYLQNGTVMIFDDWNCFNADDTKGERRAAAEFLEENKNIKLQHLGNFGWHGAYFLVTKE
jgi:hypothetical protein